MYLLITVIAIVAWWLFRRRNRRGTSRDQRKSLKDSVCPDVFSLPTETAVRRRSKRGWTIRTRSGGVLPVINSLTFRGDLPDTPHVVSSLTVFVEYSDADGAITQRHVDAHYILSAQFPPSEYLVGYCHLRSEMRSFRIDRILQLDALDQKYLTEREIRKVLIGS